VRHCTKSSYEILDQELISYR